MKMSPRVSVVMPCFNGEQHIRASIASVLEQSFRDVELIVVDDGSTDGSAAIASESGDLRVKVHRQANMGVSAARNRGLAAAQGEFVAFLDADDTWAPTFLERMIAALDGRNDAALAYCGWQNLGLPGGRGLPFVPPDYEGADKAARLIASCPWPIHAALTRRSNISAGGGFNTELAVAEDFLLWMEIAVFHPIVRVPEVLAHYHFHDGKQATSNRERVAIQTLRAQQMFLEQHAGVRDQLGHAFMHEITFGPLLRQAYECYWARDLRSARTLFRATMKARYGKAKDWKYMLPSFLPLVAHEWLVQLREYLGSISGGRR